MNKITQQKQNNGWDSLVLAHRSIHVVCYNSMFCTNRIARSIVYLLNFPCSSIFPFEVFTSKKGRKIVSFFQCYLSVQWKLNYYRKEQQTQKTCKNICVSHGFFFSIFVLLFLYFQTILGMFIRKFSLEKIFCSTVQFCLLSFYFIV